jgi:hypothetical protein
VGRLDALRLVLRLWVVVAIAVGVRTLLRPNSHTVFPIFAASAVHWWADQSLYAEYEPLDHFRYPPVFPVLITPFNSLGLCAGGLLWSWVSMALYLAGLRRFARDVLPGVWPRRRLAAFLALALLGALRGLWNAQSNALVIGLLLLGGSSLVRRRWWRAAFLLAAAVWIKLTPLALALLLCALWPGRLGGRFLVALACLALVPFLTRPPEVVLGHYREWGAHLVQSGRERWPGFRDGWTVWQVTQRLARGEPGVPPLKDTLDSEGYRMVQLVTALSVLAWCLWQGRRGGTRWRVHMTFGIGLAWLMVFGPAVEHATHVFLAPVLAGALLDRAWPRGRPVITAAAVLILLLGWGALTRPLMDTMPVLLTTLPVGAALFALWLVAYAQTCGRRLRWGARPGRRRDVHVGVRKRRCRRTGVPPRPVFGAA